MRYVSSGKNNIEGFRNSGARRLRSAQSQVVKMYNTRDERKRKKERKLKLYLHVVSINFNELLKFNYLLFNIN